MNKEDKAGLIIMVIGIILGLSLGFVVGLSFPMDPDLEIKRLHSSVGSEHLITNQKAAGSSPAGVSKPPLPALEIINTRPVPIK